MLHLNFNIQGLNTFSYAVSYKDNTTPKNTTTFLRCYRNELYCQEFLLFCPPPVFFSALIKVGSFMWCLAFFCILEPPHNPEVLYRGVNANMAQSVCHWKETIHANLPPQTGVQLGQSEGESSGVERAQRSLDQAPDCSRGDLQLENNDGCLGQHWWGGSDCTSTDSAYSPDIHGLMCIHAWAHVQAHIYTTSKNTQILC